MGRLPILAALLALAGCSPGAAEADAPPTSEEEIEDVAIAVSPARSGSEHGAMHAAAARARIRVRPVFLVPTDVEPPDQVQQRLLSEHMAWARRRYLELLDGQDTFELVPGHPLVLPGAHDVAWYTSTSDQGAEAAVLELFARDGVDRTTCPYVYVVLFVGTGSWPAGGGRPLNGGVDTGGGIVVLAADNLEGSPNFQSTLQHELGHAFGLPHVDVYGHDMATNASLMSYNPAHHTNGLEPSSTPGVLIPEDRRALELANRIFPGFALDPDDAVPDGYELRPMVVLGPMPLPGQADYVGPSAVE